MGADFLLFVGIGFVAQVIDGALGMAYGVTASSLLLSFGIPPATASATVHAAECFTTGASAISHHAFRNVNAFLFKKLLVPGVAGAIIGAYVLTSVPGEKLTPFVAAYLLILGGVILKAPTVPSALTHTPCSRSSRRRQPSAARSNR